MDDTILKVSNLEVVFNQTKKAVDGISFELKRGRTLGIVGESGSGKSVTSLAIMGLIPLAGKITQGEIWFNTNNTEVNLLSLSPHEMLSYRGSKIGMIFQEPMSALNPVYNIGFQLTEGIKLHQNVPDPQARRLAIALLQEVKVIPSNDQLQESYLKEHPNSSDKDINGHINEQKLAFLKRYPHELSGGQLQRVMIAIAMSGNPEILIADEPTTALDVTVQATILKLLIDLQQKRGMSILFITHDLAVISQIAHEVGVMYEGKMVESGLVAQIFNHPQQPYTKGLLSCRPPLDYRPSRLLTITDFLDNQDQSPSIKVITELELQSKLQTLLGQPPILQVKDLQVGFPLKGVWGQTKKYIMAVNQVSFEVYPGEILGLVGESGCGKTTLSRTLLRLIKPMGGKIIFQGEDLILYNERKLRSIRKEIQIIFQNPFSSLDPRLSIGEAIAEPLLIHDPKNKKGHRERVQYLLERVGLNPDWINRRPHEFSGGQRQRICIARALALNPKFIICDESVSALDVSVQAQVLNLLKELQKQFNLTYIFISHDLSVVKFMSDRIMVMNKGKIEEIGSANEIYYQPQQEYTRQLIASIPKFNNNDTTR